MNAIVVLPILVPFAAASLGLVAWRSVRVQRAIALAASIALLGVGLALLVVVDAEGIRTLQVGDWPAPFGISLVVDRFSAILVVLTGLLAVAVIVASSSTIDAARASHGYYPLTLVLLAGVCGTFLTGDLFNLYVWFEVLLIASFVLIALGGERIQLEGALKYVALNLVASATLLVSIGVLYGVTGTLNLADLSVRLSTTADGFVAPVAAMLLVAFGVKAAVFPLFFWLPASYHTPPVAVAVLFSGLLTKVGVYALVRTSTLLFPEQVLDLQPLLLIVAALTMVVGVLGAVAQHEIRRLLSFHIVSQIGYLVMGLALFSVAAMAGLIYFLVHVAIAKATLFLVGAAIERTTGSSELARTGGLWIARPGLAILFGIAALSLAGVPPSSGFIAKLALVRAGLLLDQVAIVLVALAVSVLTLYSMLKIWNAAFWRPSREPAEDDPEPDAMVAERRRTQRIPEPGQRATLVASIAVLVVGSIVLSVAAGPAFDLADDAATQLFQRSTYIEAVLGVGG